MHLGFAAFWVFVAVVAVTGIVVDYKKRRIALEPLRAAIERGQQLDPQLIERLMAPESHAQSINHPYLTLGGIVTIAAGIGVAVLSFFVAHVEPNALYPMLGAGIAVVCVGLGLVIGARVVERHGARQDARGP